MPPGDDRYAAYNPRQPEQEGPGPVGYVALVLAWVAPGLGHFVIGEKARGLILGGTVYLLFAAGLFVGGIRAINPQDQPIWTYTQFLIGWPMLVANHYEHDSRAILDDLLRQHSAFANPQEAQQVIAANPLMADHPKVRDLGSVYCGIAGMLNLLVIFDVLLRITGSVREDPEALRRQRRAAAKIAALRNAPQTQTPEGTP